MNEYMLVRIQGDIYYNYRLFGPDPKNYHPADIDIGLLVLEIFSDNSKKIAPSAKDKIITCEQPGFSWTYDGQAGGAMNESCTPVSSKELKEFIAAVNEARCDPVKYGKRFMSGSIK